LKRTDSADAWVSACPPRHVRYGRAYPAGRRQIAGSVLHLADSDRYSRLNDVVCVCSGEVRASNVSDQESPDLVMDVAELIWEPMAE
jgi:hypothetical protein